MKLSHLTILFSIIFIAVIIVSSIKTDNLKTVEEAKTNMDIRVENAVEDAANVYNQLDGKEHVFDKVKAVNTYFRSFASALGIISDPIKKNEIREYTPLIIASTYEGYYIFYYDEYIDADGDPSLIRKWTELKPYKYEDENFIYTFSLKDEIKIYDKNNILDTMGIQKVFDTKIQDIRTSDIFKAFREAYPDSFLLNNENYNIIRQQAIIDCLEKDMAWYLTHYNSFAENYGITYKFALPSEESQWTKTINGPGILVVFQGMPLWEDGDIIYKNIIFSGGGLQYSNVYYIEQKGWYYVYHKKGCKELLNNSNVSDEEQYSIRDCVEEGAYACPICQPNGVHAPDYP